MHKLTVRQLFVVAVVAAGLACNEAILLPVDSEVLIEITSDKSKYQPGSSVVMTVHNADSQTFTYGGVCGYVMEVRVGSTWELHDTPPQTCPGLALIIGPTETDTYGLELPDDLSAGEYRIRLAFQIYGVSPPGDLQYRRSNSFTVAD